ncbi:hypothetical protein BDF20DRAFT_883645 [Mycotypha africana]|uniref:uncharacterized protein n=1 Tax=Mycotypha africana TaxID=64632 RepID=UPI0023014AA1|nr:uncharacterized protein BDF20DRAFT_883645 [Mycotypha africana]KAI8973694.1 hypothetical protein BDF20DRAFT_883645 [Mycotypha africana]
MKFSLLLTASVSLLSIVSAQQNDLTPSSNASNQDSFKQLRNTLYQHDNSVKNIAFFAAFGGSSHCNWVLSFMDELGARGHNAKFLTANEMTAFGRPFKHVETVSVGPIVQIDRAKTFKNSEEGRLDTPMNAFLGYSMMQGKFDSYYHFARDYFIRNNVDVVLCDHFADACLEAALSLKLPFIVTSTILLNEESSAPYTNDDISLTLEPTTEFESFSTRFYNKLIYPFRYFYDLRPAYRELNAMKAAATGDIGIKRHDYYSSKLWKDSLKIINSLYGFTAPRPLDPLTELVGPIMPSHYKPLTPDLEVFLNMHRRVAYIAFGQNATPSEAEIKLILTTLMECLERGYIDGIVWATVHAAGRFPDTVTTTYSNTTYDVSSFFKGGHPDVKLITWAPQIAILNHPSSHVFVSHGGQGSWYESVYSGTRMLMFPFFADQPINAVMVERSGLGGRFDTHTSPEEMLKLFEYVIMDPNNEIKENVKRAQALMQVHSRRSIARAADLVEEVAFTHKDGKLIHRETADRRMSFLKTHHLDIYGAALFIVFAIISVIKVLTTSLVVPLFKSFLQASATIARSEETKIKSQ